MDTRTPVIALDHLSAFDAARVGRKAATLAVARAAGLPVGPGVVLTTEWSSDEVAVVHQVWRIISHDGELPLVVRRSPTARGPRTPRPLGVVGAVRTVAGAAEFAAAVETLHDSATAVLVQPVAEAVWRGVVFGDGPSTGQRTRPVVACVATTHPDDVWVAEIDHHGRTRDVISGGDAPEPPLDLTALLARLSRRVDRTFEGVHDVDWVARSDGGLRLVDIRPGLAEMPLPHDADEEQPQGDLVDAQVAAPSWAAAAARTTSGHGRSRAAERPRLRASSAFAGTPWAAAIAL